jgi:Fe-S cluster biogenesis protein NfuA
MWKSAFSGEVSFFVTFNIVMSTDSIIVHMSSACFGCMSWCYLITISTGIERTVPFKMGRVAAFETLILSLSIVTSIGCAMRVKMN